jgi:hypothetical protein
MKRVITTAVVALALGVAPGMARAAPPDLTTGTGSVVNFSGSGVGGWTAHVDAKSFDGLNPQGSFFFDYDTTLATLRARGTVTCHRVVGNLAVVGGAFDEPQRFGIGTPVAGLFIFIQDNGSPGTGNDRMSFGLGLTPPQVCPPPIIPSFPLTQGNYEVKDR